MPIAAALVAVLGPRADLAARATTPAFLVSLLVLVALLVVSAGAALVSSVPGHDRRRMAVIAPAVLILVWAVALAVRLGAAGPIGAQLATEPTHTACPLQISLIALLPAIALLVAVRRGASVAPGWSGVLTLD